MKGKIQSKYKKSFNPTFRTVIMGQMVDISLSQAENEAEKFALTAMGHMYEDHEDLKTQVLARQAKPELVTLDMSKADRGSAFEKGSSPKAERIATFEATQEKNRAKVGRRKNKEVLDVKKTTKKKSKKKRVSKKK